MANIIIKSDERQRSESKVLQEYGKNNSAENRELAECVAARLNEVQHEINRMEDHK